METMHDDNDGTRSRIKDLVMGWVHELDCPTITSSEFAAAITQPGELHWQGGLSKRVEDPDRATDGIPWFSPKRGVFWTPAVLDPAKMPRVGTKDWKLGKGINADAVAAMPVVMAEMDDGTLVEQLCRLAIAITRDGLPLPTAVIFSGSKSIHAFWRLLEPFRRYEVAAWKRVQQALIVQLGGDDSITDITRRMRWGTGPAGTRQAGPFESDHPMLHVQPVLGLGPSVSRDAMESWASTVQLPIEPEVTLPNPVPSRSVTPTTSLITDRDIIDLDAVFGAIAQVKPGEKVPACCPNPDHHDSNASGFLSASPRGRFFTCPQVCKKTWWDIHSSHLRKEPSDSSVTAGSSLVNRDQMIWSDTFLTDTGYLNPSAMMNVAADHHQSHQVVPAIFVFQTGLGTGKTQVAAMASRKRRRVVAVAPLRSLVRGLRARIEEQGKAIAYYEDIEADEIADSVAICFPSVSRVRLHKAQLGDPFEPDDRGDGFGPVVPDRVTLCIFDELEETLRGLVGHLGCHQGVRAYLGAIQLIKASRYTLILDGHAGPCVRQLLDDLGNHDAQVWVRQPREPRYTWVSHPRRATLDLDLLRAVAEGERVGVACGSAAHAL